MCVCQGQRRCGYTARGGGYSQRPGARERYSQRAGARQRYRSPALHTRHRRGARDQQDRADQLTAQYGRGEIFFVYKLVPEM